MNILDPIRRHARQTPEAAAILHPGGSVSRARLVRSIGAAARHFSGSGLKPGDLVGLVIGDPLSHLVSALGLAGIGVAHVALPVGDPPMVRKRTLDELGLDTVVCDSTVPELSGARVVPGVGLRPPDADAADAEAAWTSDGALTWLLIKSSGTTGDPKFAELSHALSMERHRRYADAYGYRPGDVFWIGIDIGTVTAKQHILSALQAGVAVCMPIGVRTPFALLDFVRSSRVTLAYDIPSHLWGLTRCSTGTPCLPDIRRFFVGTTEVSDELRREFIAKVCPNLYINYGTNEAPCVTVASPAMYAQVRNTVGVPHPALALEVVDGHGARVEDGATGEIRMRGPGIVSRYYRNPEATSRAFRDGWFHPGDLAYVAPGGAIVLQGRVDEMMIFDGVNIYPSEVERVLLQHPLVREAAVFGLAHKLFGEVPVAAVVARAPVDEGELVRWCASRLGIKCPKRVFTLDELPRNPSGKVMRRELARRFALPRPG